MQKGAAYWMDLQRFDNEDPFFLAQVQKGITNFVKILTGKDIPVQYATSGDSMTDGKTVYIASNIKESTIDYTVGLALHEASHVLLTDFAFLNKEKGKLLEVKYKIPKEDIDNVFLLVNFVEDKRIDNFIYSTAPGYQFYYKELYNKSFYSDVVDKGLKEITDIKPTWNEYLFRIVNIFNKNTDLTILPALDEVCDLLTYNRINSMKSTRDAIEVAIKIYNLIKPYLQEEKIDTNEDTSSLKNKVDSHFEKQKNFINSNYRKKRVTKALREDINSIVKSNTKINNVDVNGKNVSVIVTNNWKHYFSYSQGRLKTQNNIQQGINLGKKLLSKLKNTNTEKSDILDNLVKGKLNSSKLYQAEFSNDLFYRIEKEKYKNTFIHISIDMSGSMQGIKLSKTLQTTIALAYAACHLDNFDVEISFRGTTFDRSIPVLAYVFNSKKHSVKYLKNLASVLPQGCTPEGICLEQIGKTLPTPTHNTNVYLLNISDGMPNLGRGSITVDDLLEHTQKVVNNIKRKNIGVMSYFINSNDELTIYKNSLVEYFKKMYGKSAQFIDINNATSIANTINNLLISGDKIKVF